MNSYLEVSGSTLTFKWFMNHNCTDDGPVRRRPSDDKEQGLVLVTCLVIEHAWFCMSAAHSPPIVKTMILSKKHE